MFVIPTPTENGFQFAVPCLPEPALRDSAFWGAFGLPRFTWFALVFRLRFRSYSNLPITLIGCFLPQVEKKKLLLLGFEVYSFILFINNFIIINQ